MFKLNRSLMTCIAGAALMTPATAVAQDTDPIDEDYDGTLELVTNSLWGGSLLGGPFSIDQDPTPPNPALGEFGAQEGHFISFCLELDELIETDVTYDYNLNTAAVGDDEVDPLDTRTAFLYTQLINGELDSKFNEWEGSSFTFEYEESLSGEALQDAIWVIEDEEDIFFRDEEFTNEIIAFADEATSEGGEWFGRGIGGVRVLNVFEDGKNKQDVLTFVPLPAPAAMVFAGLAGVGLLRRMRRRDDEVVA